MKNKEKNTDRLIQRKIKKYEFEFSDHAWDKMEASMESPPPSTRSNKFFNNRNLMIMLLLLVILLTGVLGTLIPSEQSATAAIPTEILIKKLNPQLQEETIEPQILPTPFLSAANGQIWTNTQKTIEAREIFKIFPEVLTSSSPYSPIPVVRDTSFQQKLQLQLGEYYQHYSPDKVYLHLDRTFFKPGENIWFSTYVRDANSLRASLKSEMVYVELLSPNGGIQKTIKLIARNGHVKGDFKLDESAAGGMYKIKAYTNWQKNTNSFFERDIQVQVAVLPNLRMEMEFMRKAYGPGDEVKVKLDLNTLSNQALAKHDFNGLVMLNGVKISEVKGKTDKEGMAKVEFSLPKKLESNDGLLNILIEYNGQTESISRKIPIVLNKIDLALLPESGEMIAGFANKVAFKAISEFGKPADIEGDIFNSKGKKITSFRSYHQGMGAFNFTPQADENYYAKITKPVGVTEQFDLPEPLQRGYGIQVLSQKDEFLKVEISSSEHEVLTAVLQARGKIYHVKTTPKKSGTHQLAFNTDNLPIGIASLTIFDSKEIPRAERLVFLNPDKKLDIQITTDKEKYLPREKVTMSIEVKDERGMPMPGKFSLAVADDNLLTFADDKQGGIMAYLLLESELKGKIEEPNFYFEPKEKHPEKDQIQALDYLMLTQGWRRINWVEINDQPLADLQFKNETAGIAGQVISFNDNPVVEAEVSIPGTIYQTKTDENGYFRLDNVHLEYGPVSLVVKNDVTKDWFQIKSFQEDLKLHMFNVANSQIALEPLRSEENSFIRGQVIDAETKEPIPFANIFLEETKQGVTTDFDGNFTINNVAPGNYTLQSQYIGYSSFKAPLEVKNNEGLMASIEIVQNTAVLDAIVVKDYKVPMIEMDNTTQGQTLTSKQIRKLSKRNVSALASTTPGLSQVDESANVTVRGSRADATNYYIDGVRVRGNGSMIPSSEIDQLQVLTGGTPAQFGGENQMNVENDEEGTLKDEVVVADKSKNQKKSRASKIQYYKNGTYNPNAYFESLDSVTLSREYIFSKEHGTYKKKGISQNGFYISRDFYSPKYTKDEEVLVRNDFRSTVYWNPEIIVDRKGKAEVEFYTTDALTTFRATIEGLVSDGGLGQQVARFYSEQPVGMSTKIPSILLTGDQVNIPLTISNNTNYEINGRLDIVIPEGLKPIEQFEVNQKLKAGKTKTIYLKFEATNEIHEGLIDIHFNGGNGIQDAFSQTVKVIPRGFPVDEVYASSELEKTFNVNINKPIEGTLNATFTTYPSVLSDLLTGLDRMLRQPNGCFEQTSSSNYPNLLVLDYLRSTDEIEPEVEEKAMAFLKKGYKRLKTFEVRGGGFDWYGKPPAHEPLTAYGLMQFVDMQSVFNVDQNLIDRTAEWLLSRRDGNGGWESSKKGLHRWSGANPIADAYISWAVAEAGYGSKIKNEIEKSYKDAIETKDPYIMALVTNTFLKVQDKRANEMMTALLKLQQEDGSWNGLTHSMTHSTGIGLKVETTALTVLAILKSDKGNQSLEGAIQFIASSKNHYGFGSTQSTVLAMKALVEYAKYFKDVQNSGIVVLTINGEEVAKEAYSKLENNQIVVDDINQYFKEGINTVNVSFKKTENAIPYDLAINYNTLQPNNNPECQLALNTDLKAVSTGMGNNIRLTTTLENTSSNILQNPIAKVGLPAGLSAQPWQLKEMLENGIFDFYELVDGYAIFYFREIDAEEIKTISLDLKADIPGIYEAPASVAYLYYTNEFQNWSKPERLVINE